MNTEVFKRIFLSLFVVALLPVGAVSEAAIDDAVLKDKALEDVIAGEWRSVDDKSRDTSRRPGESLQFWGLKPGASILEVQPGAGWWTQILAPYAARTGGRYAATAADLGNPNLSEAAPLPEDSYDFILVSRSIHGWMRNEGTPKIIPSASGRCHRLVAPFPMARASQPILLLTAASMTPSVSRIE